MLSFGIWIYVDVLVLLLQLGMCRLFFSAQKRRFGSVNTLGMVLSAFLFVAPIGLFPVGLSWVSERDSVFRDFFWHWKIPGGMSFCDVLILGAFCVVMVASRRDLFRKRFLAISIFPLAVFLLGCLSLVNAPLPIDFKLALNSTRTFMLVGIGAALAYRLTQRAGEGWIQPYLLFLVKVNALSMASMLLLEYDAKAVRYWASSVVQSQGATTVAIIVTTYLLYSQLFANLRPRMRWALYGFVLLIAIGGAVKGLIFALMLLLAGRVAIGIPYVRGAASILFRSRVFLFAVILLMPSAIILVNQVVFGIGAIDTRSFQIVNSTQTLYEGGPLSSLFGIGWRQWYVEYYEFPFIDQGAWTADELVAEGMKNSIQIIPYSLLRSVGVLGLLVALIFLWRSHGHVFKRENRFNVCRDFYLTYFLASEILTVPDTLPEVALFSSMMIFALAYCWKTRAPRGAPALSAGMVQA